MGSVGLGVSLLLWPLVVGVCRRKSTRLLAVVGGLISALGCLFLSFSSQLHQLYISYIAVLSIGFGITMSTSSIIIGRYFHKRRECAEMLVLTGSGVGMAVLSVFIRQMFRFLNWMRTMQAVTGLVLFTVIGGAFYRSANLYHPRRRAIEHLRHLKKSKKQQREFENKSPYFDFSPLRMRSLQMLMASCVVTSFGNYTPFILMSEESRKQGIPDTHGCLLMVFFGVAFAFGSLLVGVLIIRSSLRCMIARQYLCQLSSFGCGLVTLLFVIAQSFDAFALYVWMYGIFCGGYFYTIRVYTFELVSVKLSERATGYIALAQALPTMLGAPVAVYLNHHSALTPRSGYIVAGVSMMMGSFILFLMPWASSHPSNHEVIQEAHLRSKIFNDDLILYGMEISENCSSSHKPRYQYMLTPPPVGRKQDYSHPQAKIKLYTNINDGPGESLLCDRNSHDDGPVKFIKGTDRITDFLLRSQLMLQSYGKMQSLTLPEVRLEITNEYVGEGEDNRSEVGRDEIRQLKLEATVCRSAVAPRRRSQSRDSTQSRDLPSLTEHSHDSPRQHSHLLERMHSRQSLKESIEKTTCV